MSQIIHSFPTRLRALMLTGVVVVVALSLMVPPFDSSTANATCSSSCVASMNVSPSSGSYNPGDTLTVSIYVNSGGQGVNAVQADFSYSAGLLQFQNINASGSAFAIDASSTGGSGSVSISRGNISSVSGGSLLVAQVTFQVLSAGTATISFNSSSAVVNSSTNQDILGSKAGGSYSITIPTPPPSQPVQQPTTPTQTPTQPGPTPSSGTNKKPVPTTSTPQTTPATGTDTPAALTPTTEETDAQTPAAQNTQQTVKKQSNIWATVGMITGGVVLIGAAGTGAWWVMRRRRIMPIKLGTVPNSTFITGPVVHSEIPPVNPPNAPPTIHHDDTRGPFNSGQ